MHKISAAILMLAVFIIVFARCVSDASQLDQMQNSLSSYWNFALVNQEIRINDKNAHRYVAIDSQEDEQMPFFRLFDLTKNEVLSPSGKRETMKVIDTLQLGMPTGGEAVEIVRYIYGMGKLDGLNMVGLSVSQNQVLYVINVSSNQGVIDSLFYHEYKDQIDMQLLTLSVSPPPPPSVLLDTL